MRDIYKYIVMFWIS